MLALTAPEPVGGAYNVASGAPHTVLEMARAIAAAHPGAAIEPEVVPRYRLGDVRHVFGAADSARVRFGFEARVPFGEGMREFATARVAGPAAGLSHPGPPRLRTLDGADA